MTRTIWYLSLGRWGFQTTYGEIQMDSKISKKPKSFFKRSSSLYAISTQRISWFSISNLKILLKYHHPKKASQAGEFNRLFSNTKHIIFLKNVNMNLTMIGHRMRKKPRGKIWMKTWKTSKLFGIWELWLSDLSMGKSSNWTKNLKIQTLIWMK